MAFDVSVPASARRFAITGRTTLLPAASAMPAGRTNPASCTDLLALALCLLIGLWVWSEAEKRTATAAAEVISGHLQSYSRFRVPAVAPPPVSHQASAGGSGAERVH